MSIYSGTKCITKALCITFIVCELISLANLTFAGDVTGGRSKLAFTANQDSGYEFDTGILRGRLREAGKGLGLSSAVHVPTGTTLNGAYGILSYYSGIHKEQEIRPGGMGLAKHFKIIT